MRRYLILALFAAFPAWADLVARNGADELRLMLTKCENTEALDRIKPEFHSETRRATAFVKGKLFSGCWIDTGEGSYIIFWSDGEVNVFPVPMFTNSPGV